MLAGSGSYLYTGAKEGSIKLQRKTIKQLVEFKSSAIFFLRSLNSKFTHHDLCLVIRGFAVIFSSNYMPIK